MMDRLLKLELSVKTLYGIIKFIQSDPVNLKLGEEENLQNPSKQQDEQDNQAPTPPLQQHVRTITLTSDYRHQESHDHQSQSQEEQSQSQSQSQSEAQCVVATTDAQSETLYNEEEQQTQETTYYQHQYVDDIGRYREVVIGKSGVPQMELLDVAATAAGVPLGHYIMMDGEEEDQGGQSSSSAFMGSRLATFQVYLTFRLEKAVDCY